MVPNNYEMIVKQKRAEERSRDHEVSISRACLKACHHNQCIYMHVTYKIYILVLLTAERKNTISFCLL